MIKICKLLTCATLICGVLLCSACSGDPSDNQPPQNGEVQKVSLMDYENVSILNYGAKADGSADISAAIATDSAATSASFKPPMASMPLTKT